MLERLLQRRAFQSLWCKEEAYEERAVDLPPSPGTQFFQLPERGLTLHVSPHLSAVTTLAGDHTTLGALQGGEVEIRAFGPGLPPFSDSQGFGIYRPIDGDPMELWTACAALPEIWMEVHSEWSETCYQLDLRFLGLTSHKPLFFVFYVKAEEAVVGSRSFKPQTLHRYHGASQPLHFDQQLVLEASLPTSMELIPLAGDKSFWSSTFLASFEIPVCEGKISFRIRYQPPLQPRGNVAARDMAVARS